MPHRDLSPYIIARDIAVVGGVLLALNLGLEPNDFGWINLNPTPWLLLPLLIGAGYGLIPGTVAGLVAAGVIAWVRRGDELGGFVLDHLYELAALPLLGFLAGQWKQLQKSRQVELLLENEELNNQLGLARAEVGLLMDGRLKLQRQLALHNVEVVNLDEDLRQLMTGGSHDLLKRLLDLLHQRCRITSAAFYKCEGERLVQLAVLHGTPPLKPVLALEETPMARKALEERTLAAMRDTLGTTPQQPFLIALPWWDHGSKGVLLVQDMPLDAMAWDNLSRLEFIVHWVFALLRWRDGVGAEAGKQLVPLDDFLVLLGQALQMDSTHRLPSAVLKVESAQQSGPAAAKVRELLKRNLPATALLTMLPETSAHVALLPFAGQMECEQIYRAIQSADAGLRCSLYITSGTTDAVQFWARVMETH